MATRDDVRNWLVANVGARYLTYDSDGVSIGAQCVGLINAYTNWLGFPRIPGLYAYQLFDNAKQYSEYEVIPNSASFVPQLGDILVYGAGAFGSSVGHVEIAGDNCTANQVDALAQNFLNASATKGSPAAWVTHGYGIFRGVVRPHLAQPVQQPPATQPQGGDMPAKANLDTARILTHGVLARNGVAGRANSLDGTYDADLNSNHVGRELTNEYVQELFLSDEGRQWRDTQDANSIQGINARLKDGANASAAATAALNTANNSIAQLTTDKKNLSSLLDKATATSADLDTKLKAVQADADATAHERDDLRTQVATVQTELNAANDTIAKLKAEAEKPPAPSAPQTNNPPIDTPTPQTQTPTTWVGALLRALGIKR